MLFAQKLLFLLFSLSVVAPAADAQKRVALVVGNGSYEHTPKLTNPKNDATDVAAALKDLGFEIIGGFDLDKARFDKKVRDFAAALQGAEVGLFFFAGHGLQVAGQNYLVPIDAQLTTASALEFEMVRVDVVQRVMEHETNTNILFLDACRDNPLARNLARAMGTRSAEVGRGFAPLVSGVGSLISFSTQPGNVALDGLGRNSPFAGALARHLQASKDDLSAILIGVRNDVMKETQNKQVPWEHSALRGRFYFDLASAATSATAASPLPRAPSQLSEASEAWDRTKDTTTVAVLEAFVKRYEGTYYADVGRLRMDELKKQQLSTLPPKANAGKLATSAQSKDALAHGWKIVRLGTPGCAPNEKYNFGLTIANGAISGRAGSGDLAGSVAADGKITFSHPSSFGGTVNYAGVLTGSSGSGTFSFRSHCSGTFTAARN